MTDPHVSNLSGLFVASLSSMLDANFSAEHAFIFLVMAGSFLGAAGGGVSSDMRGINLVFRIFIAFVAGVFSAAFELLDLVPLNPALLATLVAFVAVDPKKNLSGLLLIIDRLRGIKR